MTLRKFLAWNLTLYHWSWAGNFAQVLVPHLLQVKPDGHSTANRKDSISQAMGSIIAMMIVTVLHKDEQKDTHIAYS